MSGEKKDVALNVSEAGDQLTQPSVNLGADALGGISLALFFLGIVVAAVEWLNGKHGLALVFLCFAWSCKHGETVELRAHIRRQQ